VNCGTLRGVEVSALKKNEVVESLGERILGRVALQDVKSLTNGLVPAGQQITEVNMKALTSQSRKEVRSLVCEALKGICAKCYGRNLATVR
jgi:DNA-directed RNA polymerase subunit beta'